jgi:hypothetical protein
MEKYKTKKQNPFSVTKAVDFTDQEILDYWVDFKEENSGFRQIIEPTSPQNKLIMGSKGIGKTHILRYFSYNVQKLQRNKQDIFTKIQKDGYLGIYLRCTGLNSSRFSNKGVPDEQWHLLFSYYFELELSQIFLECIVNIFALSNQNQKDTFASVEKEIADRIGSFFKISMTFNSINDICTFIIKEKREIDLKINDCIFSKTLKHTTLISQGRLINGLPDIFSELFSEKNSNFIFTYIIDEFENLEEWQQKFINTLYRDKTTSCTFRIGTRLDGIKTTKSLSANEENKLGSEYDLVCIDDTLCSESKKAIYKSFAFELILSRLEKNGYSFRSIEEGKQHLTKLFGQSLTSKLSEKEIAQIQSKYKSRLRPWLKKLKKHLTDTFSRVQSIEVISNADIDEILKILTNDDFLKEKYNCFAFYQCWSKHNNLQDSIKWAQKIKNKKPDQHFTSDMIAQIRRECDIKQVYYGIDTFIEMSSGLPRLLLVIFKNIVDWQKWSSSSDEQFGDHLIELSVQRDAVRDSVNWFFDNAISPNELGNRTQNAINRLGELFRAIRYSDKPSECSLVAFSISGATNEKTKKLIQYAVASSLLTRCPPRRGKDGVSREELYQINPMIAPRWDLSLARRGTLKISGKDLDIIFGDPKKSEAEFKQYLNAIIDKCNAPYWGKIKKQMDAHPLFDKEEND